MTEAGRPPSDTTQVPADLLESAPERGVINALLRFPRGLRRVMVVVVHLLLAVASTYLAFSLRFDGQIPDKMLKIYLGTLPWLVVARGGTFFFFRLDEGIWRYVGLWDLRRIGFAVAASTVLFFACARWGYRTDDYPRSIFLIDAALLLIMMSAFRLSPRLYRDLARTRGERRLLILGAGDTGERVLREIQQDPMSVYEPIGFVDDDLTKVDQRMHGVPVLGTVDELAKIVEREGPHEIMVAITNAQSALIRRVVTILGPFKVPITTVVVRNGNGNGAAATNEIRSLSIEDLLSRPPIGLDLGRIQQLVTGRRVLVTGAGGSIGSEICRQVAALRPEALVLFERYENGLYEVSTELHDVYAGRFVHSIVGDVTDVTRVNSVFLEHRPDIVFHAAAHKHVPLMELNPCEAVKNNVTGTRVLAETALQHGVERFILISTDKAVNPSSVMGTTKRVAELVIRSMSAQGDTRFVAVRFGNVLGSNGSVLPRFQEQIRAGGPVTVTDPAMTRYFMLIPEAVQLVVHAAAVGRAGDTMVLDMGEQIRVLDLARNLIRLSGRVPGQDIPIIFTGLRPGEKLYEELAGQGELIEPSLVDKISRIVSEPPVTGADFRKSVKELEQCAAKGETEAVMYLLSHLVPTFRPTRNLQSA